MPITDKRKQRRKKRSCFAYMDSNSMSKLETSKSSSLKDLFYGIVLHSKSSRSCSSAEGFKRGKEIGQICSRLIIQGEVLNFTQWILTDAICHWVEWLPCSLLLEDGIIGRCWRFVRNTTSLLISGVGFLLSTKVVRALEVFFSNQREHFAFVDFKGIRLI